MGKLKFIDIDEVVRNKDLNDDFDFIGKNSRAIDKEKAIDTDNFITILDSCYDFGLNGIPAVGETVAELAENYIKKHGRTDKAIDELIRMQILKCGTSGFLTGLGGLITLPITVPINLTSVLYVQLRMIAAIAYIRGYDPSDDEVRTFAYVCLTGTAMNDILKGAGIKFVTNLTNVMIKKIPGAVCIKINQAVGFRFITKAGSKGIINITKLVPLLGGVIGAGFDVAITNGIANNAKKLFVSNER